MKNKKILAFMLIAFMVIAPAVGLLGANTAHAYVRGGYGGGFGLGLGGGLLSAIGLASLLGGGLGYGGLFGAYRYPVAPIVNPVIPAVSPIL